MMRTLVIYYTLTGNTKEVAEAVAQELGAEIEEIITTKEIIKKEGFGKYFWGGKMVIMKEMPEILPIKKDVNEYDLIVFGTPVWAGNFAPPLLTFFEKYKISNKNVAVFCTHEGGQGNALKNMKLKLVNNEVMGEIGFIKNTNHEKIKEWARSLK